MEFGQAQEQIVALEMEMASLQRKLAITASDEVCPKCVSRKIMGRRTTTILETSLLASHSTLHLTINQILIVFPGI